MEYDSSTNAWRKVSNKKGRCAAIAGCLVLLAIVVGMILGILLVAFSAVCSSLDALEETRQMPMDPATYEAVGSKPLRAIVVVNMYSRGISTITASASASAPLSPSTPLVNETRRAFTKERSDSFDSDTPTAPNVTYDGRAGPSVVRSTLTYRTPRTMASASSAMLGVDVACKASDVNLMVPLRDAASTIDVEMQTVGKLDVDYDHTRRDFRTVTLSSDAGPVKVAKIAAGAGLVDDRGALPALSVTTKTGRMTVTNVTAVKGRVTLTTEDGFVAGTSLDVGDAAKGIAGFVGVTTTKGRVSLTGVNVCGSVTVETTSGAVILKDVVLSGNAYGASTITVKSGSGAVTIFSPSFPSSLGGGKGKVRASYVHGRA